MQTPLAFIVPQDTLEQAAVSDTFTYPGFLLPTSIHDTAAPIVHKNKYFPSFFQGHQLKPKHSGGQILEHKSEDWLIGVLLFALALIAYLRVSYYRRFNQLITASFDFQLSNQLVREESILTQRVSLFLTFIFWVSIAMFVSQLLAYFHISPVGYSNFTLFGLTLLFLGTIYFIKVFSLRLVGNIFQIEKESETYIFNVFLYNKLSGLLFLPLVILVRFLPNTYSWPLFVLGFGILILVFAARIARGVFIGIAKKGVSFIHIVLYFCTLEILPLLLMAKFLSTQ